MMSEAILRLTADEVWTALETIDPVSLLAEELIDRVVGNDVKPPGALSEWTDRRALTNGTELVVFDHPDEPIRCLLPVASLRMARSAALAALAARELLVPGGVTVAVLGASRATDSELAVIARHVPDISHVAVLRHEQQQSDLPVRLTEQLELSGIRLSVMPTVADTVFGANLVVTTDDGDVPRDMSGLRVSQLARGTVLINTTGRDLPADLVDQVDELYVDDFSLLERNKDRYFVSAHCTGSPGPPGVERPGPRIAADLGELLAGRRTAREHVDNVVLVELLSARTLTVRLAHQIQQAAVRAGLGTRVEL
jgi:ornithine cyclodeaminase/alanine dehydrogenase-like protein (mu-crystallin family)